MVGGLVDFVSVSFPRRTRPLRSSIKMSCSLLLSSPSLSMSSVSLRLGELLLTEEEEVAEWDYELADKAEPELPVCDRVVLAC